MSTTHDETTALARALVNDDEVAILNNARVLLRELQNRWGRLSYNPAYSDEAGRFKDQPSPYSLGRLVEAADAAESGLFNVLNVANSVCYVPLTDEQLSGRPR